MKGHTHEGGLLHGRQGRLGRLAARHVDPLLYVCMRYMRVGPRVVLVQRWPWGDAVQVATVSTRVWDLGCRAVQGREAARCIAELHRREERRQLLGRMGEGVHTHGEGSAGGNG